MKILFRTGVVLLALLGVGGSAQADPYGRDAYDTIVGFYQRYLRRSPRPQEARIHLDGMRRNGSSLIDVEASFLGSPEYYRLHRNDPRQWVRGMFNDVLDREPDRSEMAHWLDRRERLRGNHERLAREFLGGVRTGRDHLDDWQYRRSRDRHDRYDRYPSNW
jgi:hypothetical protein